VTHLPHRSLFIGQMFSHSWISAATARNGTLLFKLNFIIFTNGFPMEFSVIIITIICLCSRASESGKISRNSTRESCKNIIHIEMRKIPRSINQKPIKLLAYLCKNKKLSCQSSARWRE
jgi:hypothetical protein